MGWVLSLHYRFVSGFVGLYLRFILMGLVCVREYIFGILLMGLWFCCDIYGIMDCFMGMGLSMVYIYGIVQWVFEFAFMGSWVCVHGLY
jgi:hypothetical protein